VTLLNRAPIFDPPEIHPLKIVAAICEGLAGAKQRLLAIAMEDQDTEFVVGFVLHENSQVRSTIAIEIAALQEGVDPTWSCPAAEVQRSAAHGGNWSFSVSWANAIAGKNNRNETSFHIRPNEPQNQ